MACRGPRNTRSSCHVAMSESYKDGYCPGLLNHFSMNVYYNSFWRGLRNFRAPYRPNQPWFLKYPCLLETRTLPSKVTITVWIQTCRSMPHPRKVTKPQQLPQIHVALVGKTYGP